MTKFFNGDICYKIHAQLGKELVVIKNILTQSYFVKKASEIVFDLELLSGFSAQDAALIGVVAGMAINNVELSPHAQINKK